MNRVEVAGRPVSRAKSQADRLQAVKSLSVD